MSQRLEPGSPHQNMALVTRFDQPIEPGKFLDAVDSVVAESDALRTIVMLVDGVPHRTVSPVPPAPCKIARVAPTDFDAWISARVQVPLDTATAAYESVLVDLGEDDWAWFVNVHHLVIDAASSENFFNAVAKEYEGDHVDLLSYADVVAELLSAQKPVLVERAKKYWDAQPAPAPTQMYRIGELTTLADRVRIDMSTGRQGQLDELVARKPFALISPELSRAVALAVMTASYLGRMGNETVTIGVPIHHRSTRETKGVIGPLIELFPLQVTVDREDTFSSLHSKIARQFFQLLSNAHLGMSPRQDFDVVLNVQTATLGDFGQIGASTQWIHPGHIDPHHQLRVQALDYDGTGVLEVALDINHRAGDAVQRQRAGEHVAAVLDAFLADPDQPVHSIGLVGRDEKDQLAKFADSGPGTPLSGGVVERIAEELKIDADRSVIQGDDGTALSAQEFDERVEHVAERLCKAGYGPGDRIGVEIGPSVDAVVAIHGIQRAGAAFVPIDPAYPDQRRAYIREDSGCEVVVTSVSDFFDLPIIAERAAQQRPADSDIAYVIYTSGSTGLPKGVPITYAGLNEYLGFAQSAYVGADTPTMPLFTSLSFDLTITTLYLPFLTGGMMTVHRSGGLSALREIVEQDVVTLMKATPSHLELLVKMLGHGPESSLSKLSGIIVGGEAFMTDLADRFLDVHPGPLSIYNEYGPTETVVGCMIHRYDPESDPGPEVPIGRPAPGVELFVLDAHGQQVPFGVPGELLIGRNGMTAGYLRREELNADRFMSVDSGGGVAYRSGDLVKLIDPNTMVYLGRIDEQIKVGGIRLEPGEIEYLARSVPGVRNAVARLWSPRTDRMLVHCVRCGLPSNVPDVEIDQEGVCSSCHQFDAVAPQADEWFKTQEDLEKALAEARSRSIGDYDVIHLISGGKDSTYALYKLVELGARVFAVTLDNGYLADEAIANAKRATKALGVDHEIVTVDGMNEIFRDSLERFSNVCNGCYKAIYTVALAKAEELGIRSIVTGLSRGQFFETRLVPGMFGADRFDPDAIDEMVREARRAYHNTSDAVSEQMDVEFLEDHTLFDRVSFIDLYRYVDVPLSELYETLEGTNTWKRPPDSGRSTNCLINAAGIFVHKMEQGHHNYAVPYSWDVRLGHKTREEALFELDDPMDADEIAAITTMLAEVGYEPKRPETLTLWIEADEGLDLEVLNESLREGLPAHSVPRAIEVVDQIPLTTNGKVDTEALPAPALWRSNVALTGQAVAGETEEQIASIWRAVLGIPEVTATEDFFTLGGTSLHALEMIVRVSDHFGLLIAESLAFKQRTIAELAEYIEENLSNTAVTANVGQLHIPELDLHAPAPLSAGEESMLYEWRRDPEDLRYNVARLYYLPEDVDRDRLNNAIRTVVENQPTLRTSYGIDRTELLLDAALRISHESSSLASLSLLAESLNLETFDLVNGPLITAHHLESGHPGDLGTSGLLLRTHHISSDAGSLDVLWNQIDLAYRGESLPELEASYAAHGRWLANRPARPEALWDPDGAIGKLSVRGPGGEADGYVHQQTKITATQLRNAPAPTLFGNAMAALAAAVRPAFDGPTLELTVTSSVRDHPAIANVVGYFLNPLPLLIDVADAHSLGQLARTAGEQLADSLEHRAVPWRDVRAAAAERGISAPTGQVMLAIEELAPAYLDGSEVRHEILSSGTAVNDLTFFVQIRGELVEIGCEYRGATVGRERATALLEQFSSALDLLVEAPGTKVQDLVEELAPLMGPEVRDESRSALSLIAGAVGRNPEATAVRCGQNSLTYAELDAEAHLVAARLRAVGVRAGDRVALCVPRSVELISSIWGIWLLGASYVPLDVSQPAPRLASLVAQADVRAAVSAGDCHAGLAGVPTVLVDQPDKAVLPIVMDDESLFNDSRLDTEAYLIFTSGSTGLPKGVPISHRNLRASLAARREFYTDPVERYLLMSSAGFDSSVAGIFWTLADGGELVLPTEVEAHDVDQLGALIADRRISHMLTVPSLYGALVGRDPALLASLQTMIVAGEACPPGVVEAHFRELPDCELINEYGPTEATVWATAHRCRADDGFGSSVSIGAPIPGMICEVVDASGRPVALDVPGELVLSGTGVSTGYIDGPSDVFFGDDDEVRSYRTGDLVIRRSSNTIDFVGRLDEQLSVGGVRVDPVEIESAISGIDGVGACIVVRSGRGLVAYVEPSTVLGDTPRAADIRRHSFDVLPATHVPTAVVVVESLPRTINGKLDRAGLDPAVLTPLRSGPTQTTLAAVPASAAVTKIANVFSRAFDGAEVGPDSDFFDLGGDSLHAVAIVSMIESEFGRRVAIGELIDAPTPALLAAGTFTDDLTPSGQQRPEGSKGDLVEWLRKSGGQRPLVLLPPGGGNLLRYAPLVKGLDADIPVVGIRLPGADARSEIAESIAEQATVMLDALDTAVPTGPHVLVGWSTGGLLAWEMARLLLERGDEVEAVVLIDTVMAGLHVDDTGTIREKYQDLFKTEGLRAVAAAGTGRVTERASFALARRRYRHAREAGTTPTPIDAERQLGPIIRRAARDYEPPRQDVRVVYVSATESADEVTLDPWCSLQAGAPFEVITIDGVHFLPEERCILGQEKAPELAEQLLLRLGRT